MTFGEESADGDVVEFRFNVCSKQLTADATLARFGHQDRPGPPGHQARRIHR